ncbi:MAG: substrate-binding domain-containing protein, partial [Oscillospiraceae bacterium]|nr:substrate-binding domain-containing protein [Oscillospiraceae bacterium]
MKRGKTVRRLILMALCLCLSLSSCAAGGKQEATRSVTLIGKSNTTEFWKSVIAGASAAKSEYNVNLTIKTPMTEEDYQAQNNYIEEAVAEGADAIIFSAISYTDNADAINEAIGKGVKVIVIDSDVDSPGVSVRIGTDNVNAGRKVAQAVLDTDQEEIYVGIVNYDVVSRNGQEREMGLREGLAEDGRVRQVYTVNVITDQ